MPGHGRGICPAELRYPPQKAKGDKGQNEGQDHTCHQGHTQGQVDPII